MARALSTPSKSTLNRHNGRHIWGRNGEGFPRFAVPGCLLAVFRSWIADRTLRLLKTNTHDMPADILSKPVNPQDHALRIKAAPYLDWQCRPSWRCADLVCVCVWGGGGGGCGG